MIKNKKMRFVSALIYLGLFIPLVAENESENVINQLREKADYVVTSRFGKEGKKDEFDIGVGEKEKTVKGFSGRKVVLFSPSDLVFFFENQKHKDLIVLNLFGYNMDGAERIDLFKKHSAFFKDAGYKRVVLVEQDMNESRIVWDSNSNK